MMDGLLPLGTHSFNRGSAAHSQLKARWPDTGKEVQVSAETPRCLCGHQGGQLTPPDVVHHWESYHTHGYQSQPTESASKDR